MAAGCIEPLTQRCARCSRAKDASSSYWRRMAINDLITDADPRLACTARAVTASNRRRSASTAWMRSANFG